MLYPCFFNFGPLPRYATTGGKHNTVKVLLDYGANVGADPNGGPDGVKALLLAAEVGATEIIKELVEDGANPNVTNIVMGAIQIIKLLVEAGVDPNVASIHGLKPIEIAAVNVPPKKVEDLSTEQQVERELMLVKLNANKSNRAEGSKNATESSSTHTSPDKNRNYGVTTGVGAIDKGHLKTFGDAWDESSNGENP
ncbi:hypothetical protein MKX01_022938, partial [Papaver californicum]